MVRQAKIPPKSEGIVIVATNAGGLVEIEPLLERDITQAWTTAWAIVDALPNRSFNVLALSPTNDQPFLVKHQQIATEPPLPSTIIQNKLDELSPHISILPLCKSVNSASNQIHVGRLLQMANHKKVAKEDELWFNKDW